MKFRIKKKSPTAVSKITRIEVRSGGKSKVLTLEHVNAQTVFNHLRKKLAGIKEAITLDLPIIESPVGHVKKCRIQVFEASTDTVSKKENFKSFTCYGIDNERALELITEIIEES